MKTSFFTAVGLLALAGLGATNPVAQGGDGRLRPQSSNNGESEQLPPPGRGRGRGKPEHTRLQKQQQYVFFCKAGNQGDIGQICEQCQGTPVQDPSCAPAKQGCQVKDDTCFTNQKCQQEYGQKAKAQQCGKQQASFNNNQLLGTNQKQQTEQKQQKQRPEYRSEDSILEG